MKVSEALAKRKSTRAFLDREVVKEKIMAVLRAARYSPSGANTQPWQVGVVTGARKKELQQKIETAFRNGEEAKMDFQYYPLKWVEPYKTRRIECGLQLYSTLGITRQEKDRRLEQWAANYRAFDAPVMLFFFLDPGLETGSYMDYGMFLQSVMLAAMEEGLATCPRLPWASIRRSSRKSLVIRLIRFCSAVWRWGMRILRRWSTVIGHRVWRLIPLPGSSSDARAMV